MKSRFTTPITIEKKQVTQDATYGTPVVTWVPLLFDSGTAQGGSANTLTLAASASKVTGIYDNHLLSLVSGAGATQERTVSAYDGGTKVATVSPGWGPVGFALSFDGVNDIVTVSASGNPELRILGDVSLFAWITPSDATPPNDLTAAVIVRCGTGADNDYTLQYDWTNQRLLFHWYDGEFKTVVSANGSVSRAQHHVGCVRESNQLQFYLDGLPLGAPQAVTTPTVNAGTLAVGASTTTNQRFTGIIDEVRVFDRALDSAEALNDAAGAAPAADCVLQWKFDEGTGTSATDSSSNGNTGALNGPTWTDPIAITLPDATTGYEVDSVAQERFWAEVVDTMPSRSEGVTQGLQVARNQTRLRMRWRDDIDSSMRVTVHKDSDTVFHIVAGPADILGRKQEIEMVLERFSS